MKERKSSKWTMSGNLLSQGTGKLVSPATTTSDLKFGSSWTNSNAKLVRPITFVVGRDGQDGDSTESTKVWQVLYIDVFHRNY